MEPQTETSQPRGTNDVTSAASALVREFFEMLGDGEAGFIYSCWTYTWTHGWLATWSRCSFKGCNPFFVTPSASSFHNKQNQYNHICVVKILPPPRSAGQIPPCPDPVSWWWLMYLKLPWSDSRRVAKEHVHWKQWNKLGKHTHTVGCQFTALSRFYFLRSGIDSFGLVKIRNPSTLDSVRGFPRHAQECTLDRAFPFPRR